MTGVEEPPVRSRRSLDRRLAVEHRELDDTVGRKRRRIEDEALHHYKDTAARLQEAQEKGWYEKLIVGCHDVNWRDFEEQLHPYVTQRLLGRFSADIGKMTGDSIREHANRLLTVAQGNRRQELVQQVLDEAIDFHRSLLERQQCEVSGNEPS